MAARFNPTQTTAYSVNLPLLLLSFKNNIVVQTDSYKDGQFLQNQSKLSTTLVVFFSAQQSYFLIAPSFLLFRIAGLSKSPFGQTASRFRESRLEPELPG